MATAGLAHRELQFRPFVAITGRNGWALRGTPYTTLLKEDLMTKNELIAAIADETGKSKADVTAILASLGTIVAKTLKSGEDITLGGVGKLSAAKREAREARNPSTGATIKVPAKTVVKFKVTKDLAEAVA
jgi:DNA-binding protein HU-beta